MKGLRVTAFEEEGFFAGEGEAGVEEGSVFWGVLPDVAAVVAVHCEYTDAGDSGPIVPVGAFPDGGYVVGFAGSTRPG